MGQKVHPLGFRVGIIKKHQSQWFARFNKYKYAQTVLEDRMLRQTITNLLPQLVNPANASLLKNTQKAADSKDNKNMKKNESGVSTEAKITQIKIERGLIPYEIGIQIYAENCDLLKKSIENLKVNNELLCQLQKTRRYLQHLRSALNDLNALPPSGQSTSATAANVSALREPSLGEGETLSKKENSVSVKTRKNESFGFNKTRLRLTRQQLRRQRLILKRLKKRQSIRRRYKQLIFKNLVLTKEGNTIKTTKLNLRSLNNARSNKLNNNSQSFQHKNVSQQLTLATKGQAWLSTNNQTKQNQGSTNVQAERDVRASKPMSVLKSRVKKKFVAVFINTMNKKFLQALKTTFISSVNNKKDFTLNYSKKWNFKLIQNKLAVKPLSQLIKLNAVLEQKALNKMESLRKDYIASGLISKVEALNYYEMLNFLKKLKELISQVKRAQQVNKLSSSNISNNSKQTNRLVTYFAKQNKATAKTNLLIKNLKTKSSNTNVTLNVLSTKLNNIDNECTKIKFIEYLKQIVKKHRQQNIYLYLSTIADARKDLRKLQKFTKQNASFLFGSNLSNVTAGSNTMFERISNILKPATVSASGQNEKSYSEVFLEQIEKQRTMIQNNVQLTPKIAIKFYSVNSNVIKAKASVVADSIVDALEKRKAFRKVIKDAKEDLMRTTSVKGVKIQVSGRLNGAEIARSEWVRAGRVPLQTLRANIDYAYKTANTLYGIIGVRVWIFKGYAKLI